MLDQEELEAQLAILAAHRRRLAYRLRQQARLDLPSPEVAFDIEDAQLAIGDLKARLRAAGVEVADERTDAARSTPIPHRTTLTLHEQRNRTAMLAKVRTIWIKDLLERALPAAPAIALNLEDRPDTIHQPWHMQVQELNRPAHMLPPGTPIHTIFDDAAGELLILGAPGAGKTTLLLRLLTTLLDRAEQDETLLLPVVFNLSSWATKQLPLAEWLVDELNRLYDVPRKVAQSWIESDAVVPLLDGLDEVGQQRESCLEAINAFRKTHGLVPLVVCSRIADYEAIGKKLQLQRAVLLQPLSFDQVDTYVAHAGPGLAGLRAALQEDTELRALATTPLMLTVLARAYHDTTVDVFRAMEARTRLFQVWDAYITAMFSRRGDVPQQLRDQIIHTLAWLARSMRARNESILVVERLQVEALRPRLRRLYGVLVSLTVGIGMALLVRMLAHDSMLGLIWGIGVGLIAYVGEDIALAGLLAWPWRRRLIWAIAVGVSAALMWGSILGLLAQQSVPDREVGALVGGVAGLVIGGGSAVWTASLVGLIGRLSVLRIGRYGSPGVGLCVGLTLGLSTGLGTAFLALPTQEVGLLALALLVGMTFGLQAGLFAPLFSRIGFAEEVRWSWKAGVGVGLVSGLATGWLTANVAYAIRAGTFFGLAAFVLGRPNLLDPTPGNVMRRSARMTGLGLVAGLLAGGAWWASGMGAASDLQPLAPFAGITLGLILALRGGLAAFIQHGLLRLLLAQSGDMPLDVRRLLDTAVERTLLQRVGSGYMFYHRLLADYCATLPAAAQDPPADG